MAFRNQPSRLHLGPLHLPLSGSNQKPSPKLATCQFLINLIQLFSFGLDFGLCFGFEPESGRWMGPKWRRDGGFLVEVIRNCTRLCLSIQGKAVGYLSACLRSISHGFHQSIIKPSLRSNPSATLWLKPKIQPKTAKLEQMDEKMATCKIWAGFWAWSWAGYHWTKVSR